jgi:hypothetical protein
MNRKNMAWVFVKEPVKITPEKKNALIEKIKTEIAKTEKVRKAVSRIDVRAGRVYLYHLYEPIQSEGAVFTVPLIDGKYLESPYARITIDNNACTECSLDWQRHNNQWMTLSKGSLEECIQQMEQNEWFE